MKDVKEKKETKKAAPKVSYDDSELRERVERLEERLKEELFRIDKIWARLGLY